MLAVAGVFRRTRVNNARHLNDLCYYFPLLFDILDALPKPLPEKGQLMRVVKRLLSPSVSMTWCFIQDVKVGKPLGLVP